jgi:predicted MPP superfamily phosphohydrolase
MHISDLIYMWHQMRDVAISIWQLSPPMVTIIVIVLVSAAYFVFKR